METVSLNNGAVPPGSTLHRDARSTLETMKLSQDKSVAVASSERSQAEDRPASEIEPQQADLVIQQLNQIFQPLNNAIQFKMDEEAGRMVIYLKDSKTDEVIRQIPAEALLRISKNITKYLDQVQSDLRQGNSVKLPTGLITDANV